MGYESKIFVVDVHREKNKHAKNFGEVYFPETIVSIEMSKMGYDNGLKALKVWLTR